MTNAEQLFRAVGAHEYFVVRLEAQPATLVERIVEREPAGWSGLDELVDHAHELAARMPALKRVDLVVSSEDGRAEEVAARIRAGGPPGLSEGRPRASPKSSR